MHTLPPTPNDHAHAAKYSEAIHSALSDGESGFQSWFNRSDSVEQATVRGHWDFAVHILTPAVCEAISTPEKKVVLEIGYGGGRILNAACGFFQHAIGVDIHGEQAAIEAYLRSQGRSNFTLIRSDGRTLEVSASSVDLVYSFIVLQHLPTYEVFESYLQESFAALRPGGVAQLYFGTWRKIGRRERLRHHLRGYREIPQAPVNTTSLVLRPGHVRRLSRGIGFRVVDHGDSHKTVPDGYPRTKGGQSYVTLVKGRV